MAAMKEFYDTRIIVDGRPWTIESTLLDGFRRVSGRAFDARGHATVNGATRVCGDRPKRSRARGATLSETSKSSAKPRLRRPIRISTGRPDGSTILPEAHRSVPEHVGTM